MIDCTELDTNLSLSDDHETSVTGRFNARTIGALRVGGNRTQSDSQSQAICSVCIVMTTRQRTCESAHFRNDQNLSLPSNSCMARIEASVCGKLAMIDLMVCSRFKLTGIGKASSSSFEASVSSRFCN